MRATTSVACRTKWVKSSSCSTARWERTRRKCENACVGQAECAGVGVSLVRQNLPWTERGHQLRILLIGLAPPTAAFSLFDLSAVVVVVLLGLLATQVAKDAFQGRTGD